MSGLSRKGSADPATEPSATTAPMPTAIPTTSTTRACPSASRTREAVLAPRALRTAMSPARWMVHTVKNAPTTSAETPNSITIISPSDPTSDLNVSRAPRLRSRVSAVVSRAVGDGVPVGVPADGEHGGVTGAAQVSVDALPGVRAHRDDRGVAVPEIAADRRHRVVGSADGDPVAGGHAELVGGAGGETHLAVMGRGEVGDRGGRRRRRGGDRRARRRRARCRRRPGPA